MTTNTFQQAERMTLRHRAVANQGASQAMNIPAVPALQKKSVEDEESQLKSVAQLATPEEDELQMKSANVASEVSQRKDNATPETNYTGMSDSLKTGIEYLSGFSMDDVKVHYNSSQPAQLNALAYAQGTDIHVAPGQERHLPHEAWHVVQQKQGRVRPTMQMKGGINVNDDKGLENEADVMGDKAMQLIDSSRITTNSPSVATIPKIRGSVVLQGLFLPQAKRDIAEDQMTLKTEWFLAKDEDRQDDKALIAKMQTETAVRPDAIMVAGEIPPLEDEEPTKVVSSGRKPRNLRPSAPAGSVYWDQLPKHGTNKTRSFKSDYPHTTVLLGATDGKTGTVKIADFHYSLGEKSTRFVWKSQGGGVFTMTDDTSKFSAEGLSLLKRAYADVNKRASKLGCVATKPPGI